MKQNVIRPLYAIALILGVAFSSCDRENGLDQGTDEEEEQTLQDVSIGEDASDDVLEVAYETEVELMSSEGGRRTSSCAEVTHDAVNKIITIDFGDGCVGSHGRERSGKLFIQYSGEIGDSIANRIITFEEFYVNNKKVEGTIELKDFSLNDDGYLQSVKRLIELKITFLNGRYIVFNGNRTREWLEGRGDGDRFNNKYRITGSIEGISSTGRSFTHQITTPIIADWSCAAQGNFARVSGIVEMTKLGGYVSRKRIVNYGDGTCDNSITITTIRRSYTVTTN